MEEEKNVSLQVCRERIDEIDDQIINLFEERMAVCEEVAKYKIRTGMQVLDPAREQAKIEAIRQKAHGEYNQLGAAELFRQIMAISRKRQYQLLAENAVEDDIPYTFVDHLPIENVRVVFQGVVGAYSFAAMRRYFGSGIEYYHVDTWRDAMEEVKTGRADYAVVPIENSTAGIVADIYDLLMEYELYITGEQIIHVEHVLLGVPGATLGEVKEVHSHPQALAQCRAYIESHPGWETVKEINTAVAAENVRDAGDPGMTAIASREAGEEFGLTVLAEKICENQKNATRFIIVSREPVFEKDADKISICFELAHESGTLYNMLAHIIYNGLNMSRIESRPVPGKNWEYRFFVDFEGNLKDSAVLNALRGLEEESLSVRVLGNYKLRDDS